MIPVHIHLTQQVVPTSPLITVYDAEVDSTQPVEVITKKSKLPRKSKSPTQIEEIDIDG